MAKTIIVTGASRGIGLAVARYIIGKGHNVVVSARSKEALEELKEKQPKQVRIATGDMADASVPRDAVAMAVAEFGQLDGIVINHGMLDTAQRIAQADVSHWKHAFDINFFSAVSLLEAAIPHLRKSKGNVIFTSTGAVVNAYSSWGSYGASKSALKSLGSTLAVEEPDIISLSIAPGVVDTDMQKAIRDRHVEVMDEKDKAKFIGLHEDGKLLRPEQPGYVIAKLALDAPKNLSGQFLSWNDSVLHEFQWTRVV